MKTVNIKKVKLKNIKKSFSLLLALGLASQTSVLAPAAVRDYFINSTEPDGVYTGRAEATGITYISNPGDVAGHWAREPIAHALAVGAMNFGADGSFLPNAPLTIEDAVAFAVNIMGLGNLVMAAGLEVRSELAELGVNTPNTLSNIRGLGYVRVGYDAGLISYDEFSSFVGSVEAEPEENGEEDEIEGPVFLPPVRNINIERQYFALLVARALSSNDAIVTSNQPAAMLSFSDWEQIGPDFASYVEALSRVSAMGAGGVFNPNSQITRAEAAQVLRNLGDIFYEERGFTRHVGTVAYYRDIQYLVTLGGEVHRNYLIRSYDGFVNILQHRAIYSPPSGVVNYDTVVFRNGTVGGFSLLEIDDQIEFIVDGNLVIYINVVETTQNLSEVTGRLVSVDTSDGTITLRDAYGNEFVYRMLVGTFGDNYIFLDYRSVNWDELPFGAFVTLELINNLVNRVSFIGHPQLVSEMRGIVIDNNPDFGYITFIDNNANIVTRFYNQNDMMVSRTPHYSTVSGSSYLRVMFPNASFDDSLRSISQIVPGDIVFMRFSEDDLYTITHISAAANFTQRFGLVRGISRNGDVASVLLQFDNGSTAWFDLGPSVFVTRAGVPVSNREIEIGDRLRLLVNQAVLGPGHIVESVLEASLEGQGHHIGQILTGSLAGVNNIQNNLMLQNARNLTNNGWGANTQISELNLGRQNIDFFHEGSRISMDHAFRFLGRSSLYTYVAMNQSPSGAEIRQITFREGRSELLQPDVVISTTGAGEFMIASINGHIATDEGTIVRREGRRVTSNEIFEGDFVTVSLSGGNLASIVDITRAPAVDAVNIARVRIANINPRRNFQVTAMSTLLNGEWAFTSVERVFDISPNTLFIDSSGFIDPENFIDFGDYSRIDDTFTVIYNGSVATHVIDAPFGNRHFRGVVVSSPNAPFGEVVLRDAQYLEYTNIPIPSWRNVASQGTPVLTVDVVQNSIIVRGNEIVNASSLNPGDRVRVLANAQSLENSDTGTHAYIILVES